MPKHKLNIIFVAYDDGVAFRYQIPEQEGIDTIIITDEHPHFTLKGDYKRW